MTLSALAELQAIDGEADQAQKRQRELGQLLADRHQISEAEQSARKASGAAAESHAKLRDRELELKTLEMRIADLSTKLYGGRIHNPKELENYERELRMFQQHQSKLEEAVLVLMETTEQAEAEATNAQRALEAVNTARALAEQEWQSEAEQLNPKMAEGRRRAAALRAQIDSDHLAIYDRLRRRMGLVVAPVRHGNCGACGVGLSNSIVELARSENELAQCDNCGRILYLG